MSQDKSIFCWLWLGFILVISGVCLASKSAFNSQHVVIESKGFAIDIPQDWIVNRDTDGATLFIEAPISSQSAAYRRNIRVMSFANPVYIDTFSLEEMAEKIANGVSSSTNLIGNYQVTDRMVMDFENGLRGLLYYGEFMMSGVPMMQMHLVVSSADSHFIIAYTDLKKNFDFDNNPLIDQVFAAMGSIQLSTMAPERFILIKVFAAVAGGLFSLGLFVRYMMRRRTHLLTELFQDEYSNTDHLGDDYSQGEGIVTVDQSLEEALTKSISGSRRIFSIPKFWRKPPSESCDEFASQADIVDDNDDDDLSSIESFEGDKVV